MKLVDTEIKDALDSGTWKAYRDGEPIGSADLQIGPNSVDCSLGAELLEVKFNKNAWLEYDCVDPKVQRSVLCEPLESNRNGAFEIEPGNLYLASVRESFDCSAPLWVKARMSEEGNTRDEEVLTYFAPMIDGRSTLARVGLSVHQTAGFGDWGFDRPFTLELTCVLPIVIYPGMRIAQVSFDALCGQPTQRYSGAYSKQTGPCPAVLGKGRI